jgi:cytochrome c biogenesis protein CcmG/thiol:disulfide interchange protein DsbE
MSWRLDRRLCAAARVVACIAVVLAGGCEQPHRPRPASKSAAAADGLIASDGPALLRRMRASGRKGTLVNVWASWCGSCKRELPLLIGMAGGLEREGIGLVLVTADEPSGRKAAAEQLAKLEYRAPAFVVDGPLATFKRAINPAWKGAIPSTFLFDADGTLKYFWPGPVLVEEIEPIVEAFLAGEPLEGPTMVEPGPPPG